MPLARRSGQRFEANIWPGFVDAMTALLLILTFVLSIFMIVQFSLRETITGQSQKLNDLNAQLVALTDVLALERSRSAELEQNLGTARANLVDEQAETDRLNAALAAMTAQLEDAQTEAARLTGELAAAQDAEATVRSALATTRSELDAQVEAARLAAAQREAMEALIADLQADQVSQQEELTTLQADQAASLALIAALEAEQQAQERDLSSAEAAKAALEAEMAALSADLDQLRGRLTEEEEARLLEAAAAEALRRKLEQDAAELDAVTLALEAARKEAEQTLTLLAAAEAARDSLSDEQRLRLEAEAQASSQSEAFDREAALRKVAEAELAKASAQTAEQARRVALLNEQVKQLNSQLAALQNLLDETAAKEADGQVQISNLGAQLNAALARKVALEAENAELLAEQVDRLEQVRSVFLERVEGALAGRDGIKRVGDRFVFQSEVLFNAGSAELGPAGQAELTRLGEVIRELSGELPEDIDWILRVDGHTDRIPLAGTGRYRNNWELSQGRALSVVTYLIENEGADPSRLAATGFGEYRPIDLGETQDALARNRRIEFKFTER
ncbi:MAG: peptidoglycan -binding protein [Pseudomonadota bacterium]